MNTLCKIILLIDRNYREIYNESCSLSFARTVSLHRAAVQLYQMADDCQPQTQTTVLASRLLVGLTESLEDVRQKLRFDPRPRIADRDLVM